MSIVLYKEPALNKPILFCGWPGIGNVGLVAIDTLRGLFKAERFAEIEPFEFFDPAKAVIDKGLLESIEFPASRFYYQQTPNGDLMFFIGEQQPADEPGRYAEGQKAYKMAELVLDVAEKFNCRRIYTSGAAVTTIHHTVKPKVWAVPNSPAMIDELKSYDNVVLMSEIEGRNGQGAITGLNGLLLGVAKKRNIEAACLMGEVPYYLQGAPWPYPNASRSVIEVFAGMIGISPDLTQLDVLADKVQESIEQFLEVLSNAEGLPAQIREQIEQLKHTKQANLGPITEQEKKEMLDHIDDLFRGEDRSDRRHI
jgi:hypothetical protein